MTKTIKVQPDSDLAHLLEEANVETLRLEKDGVHYLLKREEAEEQDVEIAGSKRNSMTLETVYGSVPALDHPLDAKEVERIAKEEHVQRVIRNMRNS